MHVERRIGELHLIAARSRALRIFAFTGAVFPGEWNAIYSEEVFLDLTEFALHARRLNDIAGLADHNFPSITELHFPILDGDPGNWVEDYQWALNRLMHVRRFILGNAHAKGRTVFSSARSNLIPLYVQIETDTREMATISLFGVVTCFLNGVVPEVRKRFPDWIF